MKDQKYSTQLVLELACAAYRFYNNEYVKDDSNFLHTLGTDKPKYPNKDLMLSTIGINRYTTPEGINVIPQVSINDEDKEFAEKIRKYYRRAIFSAVSGDNDFLTKVFNSLTLEEVGQNQFGYIACLPHVYSKEIKKSNIKNYLAMADNFGLGDADEVVTDLDAEIIDVKKSENYDTYNVLAIIDNKIVSWMNKNPPSLGPAVLIKGKIKSVQKSWRTDKLETRLNYVKVAQ